MGPFFFWIKNALCSKKVKLKDGAIKYTQMLLYKRFLWTKIMLMRIAFIFIFIYLITKRPHRVI